MASTITRAVTSYFRQYSAREWKNYFLSTHFWGPVANWGLPLAALADLEKDPELISGNMTSALSIELSINWQLIRFVVLLGFSRGIFYSSHVISPTRSRSSLNSSVSPTTTTSIHSWIPSTEGNSPSISPALRSLASNKTKRAQVREFKLRGDSQMVTLSIQNRLIKLAQSGQDGRAQ